MTTTGSNKQFASATKFTSIGSHAKTLPDLAVVDVEEGGEIEESRKREDVEERKFAEYYDDDNSKNKGLVRDIFLIQN